MCGICIIVKQKGAPDQITDELQNEFETSDACKKVCQEHNLPFLQNRGPDVKGNCLQILDGEENCGSSIEIQFYGYVLHLRGSLTPQPLKDNEGNLLLWNGEIFGGGVKVDCEQNDTAELLKALSSLEIESNEETFHTGLLNTFSDIQGPWAFIYWQKRLKQIWFGRDFFGRRSLLWHIPKSTTDQFILTSVGCKSNKMDFTEVPAKSIYCIKQKDIMRFWGQAKDTSTNENVKFDDCIRSINIEMPRTMIENSNYFKQNPQISLEEDSNRFNAGKICNETEEEELATNSGIDAIESSLDDMTLKTTIQNDLVRTDIEISNQMTGDRGCTEKNENTNKNTSSQENTREETIKNKAVLNTEPLSSASNEINEMLNNYASLFMECLHEATRRRVSNVPRKRDYLYQKEYENKGDCEDEMRAKVGILFSGGVDSMVLAALVDRCLPEHEPIDLMNVAFEQQVKEGHKKNKGKEVKTLDKKDPYDVPDRITGKAGVMELNRKRKWNLIEINATLDDVKSARTERVRHLVYPLETVLDDSIGCAIWFAARGKGIQYIVKNGELMKESDTYTSSAKVLLTGMGADEQLGGYARHRSKFEKFGWKGLQEEMEMEIQRISSRNLGRDDRCISDHGREARFPFLDENVVAYLEKVPIWIKCDPRLPRGYGEKRLLREVARRLNLHGSAVLPKRAIQFGSKIAKLENSKEKGSDSCTRLNDETDNGCI